MIDIISVGELLIDFISMEFSDDLSQGGHFKRLPGGSPANLCMNMARLGGKALLVACVGSDDMGKYLKSYCVEMGLSAEHIHEVPEATSLILVTRSKEVSNFEAYRSADARITSAHLPVHLLNTTRLFHTTCFALSRQPARDAILNAAEQAVAAGAQLSIDANYAQKIWPDRKEAQQTLARYCQLGSLVKVSEVDWERLYESPLEAPRRVIQHFLELGAKEVCVTLGGDGCWVGDASQMHFLEARPVEVKDTTGAGDAFWSGYLTAWLAGKDLLDKAETARSVAEIKLTHFGPLPKQINLT